METLHTAPSIGMDEAIVRERATEISRTLANCRKFLAQGNVFACLTGFKDAMERMVVTRMLPQDEKDLQEGINDFQRQRRRSPGNSPTVREARKTGPS
jgi:hypothetical protein